VISSDPRDCPYVGLDPFEAAHADYFFGRGQESKIIADHVVARAVTVLYGPSGIGKSSIINVGLAAALKQIAETWRAARERRQREGDTASVSQGAADDWLIVRMRDWQAPEQLERRAVDAVLAELGHPFRNPGRLKFVRLIAWVTRVMRRRVLIILDQFEEYFLYRHKGQSEVLERERALSNLIARRDVPLHVLMVLRHDALHQLDQLRAYAPGILDTTIELHGLSDDGIKEAIRNPIARYNENYRRGGPAITVEDRLVATLISQLKQAETEFNQGRIIPGGEERRIELPYLQLALTKLWAEEGGTAATAMRESTLIKLGGVRRIVRDHVNGVMGRLTAEDQAICAKLFDRLVTAIGSKIAYPTAALAAPDVVGRDVSQQQVEAILNKLTPKEARILKPITTSNGLPGFEIFHDVLGLPVLEWKRNFATKETETAVARQLAHGLLFVSHSSKDVAMVTALEAWLRGRGFTDIFIDFRDIAPGENFMRALGEAATACRVVVCLVTEGWLASDECFAEFRAALYMGKRIIPLLALGFDGSYSNERLVRILAEDKGLDLGACISSDGRLDLARDPKIEQDLETALRAAGALNRVGLDPNAFEIDRQLRPNPFPGLASFGDDEADAALFYGRSAEITEVLEELRKMRTERDARPLVILGASGVGKSSLLKAGIIPRLRREEPAWLPLRAFRPGADPLMNFAEAIARTYADFGKREPPGAIRDRLMDAWSRAERGDGIELSYAGFDVLVAALADDAQKLRVAAGRPDASILVGVDQADEMVHAEGSSADALADYLRAALRVPEQSWLIAVTVRTDSFPEFQNYRRFRGLEARGYDLRALPAFRFDGLVEEPARRYGVAVESQLVDALMEDAPKEGALPLLALTLQRMWRRYAISGALRKDHYDRIGGLKGVIEDAAERALRGIEPEHDVPLPAGALARPLDEVGAATFVPALAQINDQGAAIRRVAAWASFDEEQQELLQRFHRWRLVVRKGNQTDGGTVEVAHEAVSPRMDEAQKLARGRTGTARGAAVARGRCRHLGSQRACCCVPEPPRQAAGRGSRARTYRHIPQSPRRGGVRLSFRLHARRAAGAATAPSGVDDGRRVLGWRRRCLAQSVVHQGAIALVDRCTPVHTRAGPALRAQDRGRARAQAQG
jgi:Novel STAND NTPase 1/TIR domain